MNIGILWDVENVRPPNAEFIATLLEVIKQAGRVSYAKAFGDWNKEQLKNIAHAFYISNFELVHIPSRNADGKTIKDSSDMSIITHGVEDIFKYPHVNKFVLVSGDADFRHLLLSQKKWGKETLVICDVKNNASGDLLKMADDFKDYRDILSKNDGDENMKEEIVPLTKGQAFELFNEAINIIKKDKKMANFGYVKQKMQLLNSQFNEKSLGYSSWQNFVEEAKDKMNIIFDNERHEFISKKDIIPEAFKNL
ncbi:MAG: NYN domain-containing protein, partial [Puniceicoccales bacterium]|nr:NYN domain-containing protein [Puniceicoccales bacterium]